MEKENFIIGDTGEEEEMMIEKLEKPDSYFRKHFKCIVSILIICLLIIIAAVAIVLFLLFWKKGQGSFGLSMEELERRTNPKYLNTIALLKEDAPEYATLEDGDKKALVHLVKAGTILEEVELQLDDHFNLPFKKFLEDQIKAGNRQAILTKILFDAQKGINGIDQLSQEVNLAAGHKSNPGKGVYPEDLTKEEFHEILVKMLKENKIEEVKNITNQRSIVIRDGEFQR